jgi:uracil DNA glycosylase
MMDMTIIHYSWKPLLKEFNTEEFLYFKNEVLPQEKYYPEASEVFRVFSMPLSEIKMVTLLNHVLISGKERGMEEGVFNLPLALTEGVSQDHSEYWEPFIKKVIYFIAKNHPCIWLLPTTKAQRFSANLPVKTIYNVLKYDDETIQHIPLNVNYNYVFKGININPLHINILLEKKGLQKINW